MSKIFRPRRGKSTTMASETKAATVLALGEMFVEVPSTGVGTGESNIKLGDGTTTYGSLPYAMGSAAPTSLVSDASTTATTALNNVTSGKSLKNILGSLKQAISLNSTSITALNDTIAGGVGLTDKEAAQLQTIYDHYSATLYLGMVVNVSLTGSHTNASYPTKVVYINKTTIHLLGTVSLETIDLASSINYKWNTTVTIGSNTYTINNSVKPTSTQIMTYCSGYQTGFTYWCNDYSGTTGWSVSNNGIVNNDNIGNNYCIIPYIVVNL